MPVNDHLNWFEITDFAPGLFDRYPTVGARVFVPSNGATLMTDCYPQPEGGLRAFIKPSDISTSGISATDRPTGILVRGGVSSRSVPGADSFDAILPVMDSSDFKFRIKRMDGSNGESTWKTEHTSAAATNAAHRQSELDIFRTTAGAIYYVVVGRSITAAVGGLYTVAYEAGAGPPAGDGVVVRQQAYQGSLAINQARIIVAEGNSARVRYSDVGALTFGVSNFVDVDPNEASPNVTSIQAFEPDDILFAKEGGSWIQMSGDISAAGTDFRGMGDEYHGRTAEQRLVRVPGGLAFIEPGGNVYITDGRTFTNISQQIQPFDRNVGNTVGVGQGAFLNNFLFMPDGYVYDFTSRSWFKVGNASSAFHSATPYDGEVWAVDRDEGFAVRKYSMFDGEDASARMDTYSWRSAPFFDQRGRNVEIREVQVFHSTYATSSIAVTLVDQDGTEVVTRTVSGLAAGRQMTSFLFPNTRDETLQVKVVSTATSSSNEAPSIERVRIGFGKNNLIA